ncbi:hypothetical protein [Xenorhabdus siamensis]|uniref:hypothetical protein n=1 Tax=Xenorhabdus siamensis TaxID=3136254 RepID=UPI0030F4211D
MKNKRSFALLLSLGVMLGLTACQSYPPGKRMVTYKPIVPTVNHCLMINGGLNFALLNIFPLAYPRSLTTDT